MADLRRRLGPGLSDEELLLRATMPAAQVDAMMAAPPATRHYNPEIRPVYSLLEELAAHRDLDARSGRQARLPPGVESQPGRWARRIRALSIAGTRKPARRAVPQLAGLLFDLDGTLLLSDRSLGGYEILPGAIEVLTSLSERGVPFVVFTNGSAYPPAEQATRLRGLGLPVPDDRMLTPSSVAAELMRRDGVERALVLGNRGVGHALGEAGIATRFTGEPEAEQVDAVYVGWHPECGMRDIETACRAIWAGAKLYVASDVPFFATKQGRSMGYSYAIVGAIRRMTKAPFDAHWQAFAPCAAIRGPQAGRADAPVRCRRR